MRAFPWVPVGWTAVGIGLAVLLAAYLFRSFRHPRLLDLPLAGVFVLALGTLSLVTGLLLHDGGADEPDSLRTGGLAAASVVALYGLWLNDRRRRTTEAQHELDRERAEHDRERIADDRFAKAVELLGNDADQVRVGAMHALAGLAKARPDYTQTVLDILCAYMRRPFDGKDQNERQARLTAQRLITDLLPSPAMPDAPGYDLDLTGARLEYLDLKDRLIGELRVRYAEIRNSLNFTGTVFLRDVWLTETSLNLVEHGNRFRCTGTVFHGKAWFSKFHTTMPVDFTNARFDGPTKFRDAVFEQPVTFDDARFAEAPDFSHTTFQAGKPPKLSPEQVRQGPLPG